VPVFQQRGACRCHHSPPCDCRRAVGQRHGPLEARARHEADQRDRRSGGRALVSLANSVVVALHRHAWRPMPPLSHSVRLRLRFARWAAFPRCAAFPRAEGDDAADAHAVPRWTAHLPAGASHVHSDERCAIVEGVTLACPKRRAAESRMAVGEVPVAHDVLSGRDAQRSGPGTRANPSLSRGAFAAPSSLVGQARGTGCHGAGGDFLRPFASLPRRSLSQARPLGGLSRASPALAGAAVAPRVGLHPTRRPTGAFPTGEREWRFSRMSSVRVVAH
jgi:hypothetical protein